MGSNYFGSENERGLSSSSSSSSSRKGKKGSSDKPKQPQRGLGVAQLEKIRLHTQLASNYLPNSVHNPYNPSFTQEGMRPQTAYSSSSSFYSSSSSPSYGYQGSHDVMMGLADIDGTNIRYGDTQSGSIARWNIPGNAGMGNQHFVEPIMTRPFFEPIVEGSNKKDMSSQNPESSSSEEIDLELRLSL
ncbi:hypothetical protein DH2020_014458 [Rehmannia glutinosa]|uniref:Protein SPEAR3-like n=1 Tax=Rehmannia glutinosa TaxID=99300 RepID=A0ABR0UY62_REHGL